MFWLCMTNGAAGHTYGANGIWQVNRKGQPHGPSPHHPPGSSGYGKIPWNESMNLPGSAQVGFGKKLFEKYAWQEFAPHPEWAQYFNDPEPGQPRWKQWIWYPEGNPAENAPAAKRYFRKTFKISETEPPTHATLSVSADDRFIAYINGQKVGEATDWRTPRSIDVTKAIRPGENVIAIEAENLPAPTANPAGLLATLQVQTHTGEVYDLHADATWRSAKDTNAKSADWMATEFNDDNWTMAQVVAAYGSTPWGEFSSASPSYGPYATGIAGKVRLIYVPEPRSIRVNRLEPKSKYHATAFDPQTGDAVELGPVVPDNENSRVFRKSNNYKVGDNEVQTNDEDDWVLVLERVD
jgi:hypothetical protein